MSRDVSSQSDISKIKIDNDGSFKRRPSSFREFITPGGKFAPEKGQCVLSIRLAELRTD